MDFIFMLTRNDRTVEDCLDLLDVVAPVGLKHIGFKDIGAAPDVLPALTRAIHETGAISYLEMVSTSPEGCLRSAGLARDIGVKRLLGGTQAGRIADLLAGSETEFFPFAGKPFGHPTRLAGGVRDVEAHCRSFIDAGCAGCDLLAYRATAADPLELMHAARRGLGSRGRLIVAGAVTSAARIRAIEAAGADAFTIGTAIFDGSYSPSKGSIRSQLRDVLADCGEVP